MAAIFSLLSISTAYLWAFLAAVLLGYLYAPYWALRRLPGPPPFPLLGHLPSLAKHGPALFSLLAKRYGPIYRFHMGRRVIVIVASPELCYEVGIKKFRSMNSRGLPPPIAASPLHQKGLFFTRDYATWRAMRNAIISVYQSSHLASLIPTMQSYIESAALTLFKSDRITFSDLSLELATDVIAQAAFGFHLGLLEKTRLPPPDNNSNSSYNTKQVSEFIREHIHSTTSLKMDLSASLSIILGILFPILQEPFRQVLKRIPWTEDSRMERTNSKLSKRVDSIVEERKREEKERTPGSNDRKNFISSILNYCQHCCHDTELFIGSDCISSLAYEHLLAGSATTSFTLSCVVYLVSQHEDVEKNLLREIDEFGPLDLVPTADDLRLRFPYLDLVVKEALRFYTVSPLIAREANQPVEIGGYLLPKSAAHYQTHKIFLLLNYTLLGACSSCIFLSLSLRLTSSAIGVLPILLHTLIIVRAISGSTAAFSSLSFYKWYGAHMVATVLTAILQGPVFILIFARTSEFFIDGLRFYVRVDNGEMILRMIGRLGVIIFCLEWAVKSLAFVLRYYAYVDGDCAKRNSRVQSEEELKNWLWPFQV